MTKTLFRLLLAGVQLFGMLSLGACGDGKKPEPEPEPPRADSIALSEDTLSFSAIGATQQLSGTVIDQYGDPMQGQTILWASDNPAVASVGASGLVTAEGDGETQVRAQAGTVRASTHVEVAQEADDIEKVEGDEQFHWTGFALGDLLKVRVVDGAGTPMVAFPVSWGVLDGGGTVVPLLPITDTEGEVSARWTLGEGPSGTQRVFATGAELDSVTFSATGTAPVRLTNSGPLVGSMLDTLKAFLLTSDSLGVPESGIPLDFVDMTGFGEIVQGATATDVNGKLELHWALGPTPGPQEVTVVRSDIGSSLEISAIATGTLDPWPFTFVAPGFYHTCAIDVDDAAYCWGLNDDSQLATDDTLAVESPKALPSALAWSEIGAGEAHTCGLTTDGEIHCWGTGFQAGQGIDDVVPDPAKVGGEPWTWLTVGANHTCGIKEDGTGWCWGQDEEGRLGNGVAEATGDPTEIAGGHTWSELSAGHLHTCGLDNTGTAFCWGQGEYGRLGDGGTEDRPTPILVAGGLTWTSIEAGRFHTCGIATSRDAWCWGEGSFNQLGNGTTTDRASPVKVVGGHQWIDITVGEFHTCGVDVSNKLYCWGRATYIGLEQFGSTIPAVVLPAYEWESVRTQGLHTCAIRTSGETYCWGPNESGQLGIGNTEDFNVPRMVYRGLLSP